MNTDYIDLYQFHVGYYDKQAAVEVRDVLEELVAAGKIRAYGWSTDDPERARVFAEGPHCTAIQQRLNIFEGNAETLAVCEAFDLASVNRGPLGMGLLSGKFTHDSRLPQDDVRHDWDLREGERAQAALGWLWARSDKTIPIPGFKSIAQVEENVGALRFGPLSPEQMQQIQALG